MKCKFYFDVRDGAKCVCIGHEHQWVERVKIIFRSDTSKNIKVEWDNNTYETKEISKGLYSTESLQFMPYPYALNGHNRFKFRVLYDGYTSPYFYITIPPLEEQPPRPTNTTGQIHYYQNENLAWAIMKISDYEYKTHWPFWDGKSGEVESIGEDRINEICK